MTNQKIKISNHITIKSKDKNLKRYITEKNHKSYNNINTPYTELPQINCQNNIINAQFMHFKNLSNSFKKNK